MKKIALAILLLGLLALVASAFGQARPSSTSYVNDYAGILDDSWESKIDVRIRQIRQASTVQMVVVTVSSLEGKFVRDSAISLGNSWGVGTKSDNGIVVFIAPNEHKYTTEVGYGLGGDLTDAYTGKVQREILPDAFRKGDFGGGIYALIDEYGKHIDPVAKAQAETAAKAQEEFDRKESEKNTAALMNVLMYLGIFSVIGIGIFLYFRDKIKKREAKEEAIKSFMDQKNGAQNMIDNLGKMAGFIPEAKDVQKKMIEALELDRISIPTSKDEADTKRSKLVAKTQSFIDPYRALKEMWDNMIYARDFMNTYGDLSSNLNTTFKSAMEYQENLEYKSYWATKKNTSLPNIHKEMMNSIGEAASQIPELLKEPKRFLDAAQISRRAIKKSEDFRSLCDKVIKYQKNLNESLLKLREAEPTIRAKSSMVLSKSKDSDVNTSTRRIVDDAIAKGRAYIDDAKSNQTKNNIEEYVIKYDSTMSILDEAERKVKKDISDAESARAAIIAAAAAAEASRLAQQQSNNSVFSTNSTSTSFGGGSFGGGGSSGSW